jgi:hypothetical protein
MQRMPINTKLNIPLNSRYFWQTEQLLHS